MRIAHFLATSALAAATTAASAAPLLRNGSFEADGAYLLAGTVGYTSQGNTVQAWVPTGNFGRNVQNNPFFDNGLQPHGRCVGFLQNPSSISQDVPGFEAGKTYVISVAANARIVGAVSPPQIRVTLGGEEIIPATVVPTVDTAASFVVPFTRFTGTYTATADGPLALVIEQLTGDGVTALIDDVLIYEDSPAAPVVVNGSFEAPLRSAFPLNYSGHPAATNNQGRGEPAGWRRETDPTSSAPTDPIVRTGLAPTSPFFDNGAVPDGAQVMFFQGEFDTLSQVVAGFQAGVTYDVGIRANSRNAPAADANMVLTIGGDEVFNVAVTPPVGGTNPFYTYTAEYTPSVSGPLEVCVRNSQLTSDLNIDAFTILPQDAPAEIVVVPAGPVDLGLASANEARTGSVLVQNIGGTDLNVSSAAFAGSDFTVTSPVGAFAVPALGQTVVSVSFSAAAATVYSDTLVISSDDADEPTVNVVFNAEVVDTPTLTNPSFELDTLAAFPGKLTSIIGWDTSGFAVTGGGVNDQALPFYDNGLVPDGTQVGFVQGNGIISTRIPGFSDGDRYRVSISLNSRAATQVPEAVVRFDGVAFDGFPQDILAVEAAESYTQDWARYSQDFTIVGDGTKVFSIEQTRPNTGPGGDYSLLFDHLTVEFLDPADVDDWTMHAY